MASSLRPLPFRGGSTLVFMAPWKAAREASFRQVSGVSGGRGFTAASPLPLAGLAFLGEAILLKRGEGSSAPSSFTSPPLPLRRTRFRFLVGTGARKADFLLSAWRGRSESLLPAPGLATRARWLALPSFWGLPETLNGAGRWLLASSFLVARQLGRRLSEGRRLLEWNASWVFVRDRRIMERWSLPGVLGESVSLVLEPMGLLSEATGRAAGLLGLEAALGDGLPTRLPDLKAARCLPPSLSGGAGVVVRPGGPGVRGSLRAVKERVHILGSPSEAPRPGVPAPSICPCGGPVQDSGSKRSLGSTGARHGESSASGNPRCTRRLRKLLPRGTGSFLAMGASGTAGLLGFWAREASGARVVVSPGASTPSGPSSPGFMCDREDSNQLWTLDSAPTVGPSKMTESPDRWHGEPQPVLESSTSSTSSLVHSRGAFGDSGSGRPGLCSGLPRSSHREEYSSSASRSSFLPGGGSRGRSPKSAAEQQCRLSSSQRSALPTSGHCSSPPTSSFTPPASSCTESRGTVAFSPGGASSWKPGQAEASWAFSLPTPSEAFPPCSRPLVSSLGCRPHRGQASPRFSSGQAKGLAPSVELAVLASGKQSKAAAAGSDVAAPSVALVLKERGPVVFLGSGAAKATEGSSNSPGLKSLALPPLSSCKDSGRASGSPGRGQAFLATESRQALWFSSEKGGGLLASLARPGASAQVFSAFSPMASCSPRISEARSSCARALSSSRGQSRSPATNLEKLSSGRLPCRLWKESSDLVDMSSGEVTEQVDTDSGLAFELLLTLAGLPRAWLQ
uniref:Uncharacterized protein n=1 Tax=Mustela putorius furo TaxID=9669 RepID=M3Z6N5_MUSPF